MAKRKTTDSRRRRRRGEQCEVPADAHEIRNHPLELRRLRSMSKRTSMGRTRNTLEGCPELSVETGGTVSLVCKAEPVDPKGLPAEIASGGLYGSR